MNAEEQFEAILGEASRNGSHGPDPEEKDRRNQADRLLAYALEDATELFSDQLGAPHALVDGEPLPLNSRCYGWLRRLMWEEEKKSVNGEYLKTAAGTLAAHAEFSGNIRELHTRAAWHAGTLYYELKPGRVVKVGAGGWEIADRPPVLFRRYPNLKPLPDPDASRGGSLNDLAGFVNLKSERDRRLYTAYLATLALPHVGRPILLATGVMGAGKTTASRLLKRLWDPTAPETVRADPRDFLQKAAHAYIVMLDNQSGLPEWAADTLCRLVTGEADSKRRLYSDDEDVIFELRRAVLLNGINVPTERGDVLDRSLAIELERIPDSERRTEEELWEEFERLHPRLLGAAFDVLARAIALHPTLRLSRRPRLADWGEYAAAVYEVMGWGSEQFLKDWDEIVRVQNQATLDGSPVAQSIIKFMEEREEYAGTSSELHNRLEGVAESLGISITRDRAWPKSARWLWRRIKEVLPLLSVVGIKAERQHLDSGTTITLRKLSTDDVSNGSTGESSVDTPNSPDNTPTSNVSSNVRGKSNVSSNVSRNLADRAGSDNTDNTDNRSGDSSQTVGIGPTPKQQREIEQLIREGMSPEWARMEVLGEGYNGHPDSCLCDECLPV